MKKILILVLVLTCTLSIGKIWKRGGGGSVAGCTGTPDTSFTFTTPLSRQIVQRNGSNEGSIPVSGSTASGTYAQARVTPIGGYAGTQSTWQSLPISGGVISGTVTAQAGWYSLEIQVCNGSSLISTQTLNKVGVGDVFVVGGQSNATNYYTPDNFTPPSDPVNSRGITGLLPWRLATDPQDTADNTHSSIVPALGNLLYAHTTYPVGFISVGLGNTAIHDWIPANPNYQRIKSAIQLLGANGFRSFMWIQGENDSSGGTSQSSYYNDWVSIIDQMRTDISWPAMPCGIAVTETHPYEATGVGTMAGQTQAATYAGCYAGANPDTLDNTYRSDNVHFNTTTGQAAHALLWYNSIVSNLGL